MTNSKINTAVLTTQEPMLQRTSGLKARKMTRTSWSKNQ